MFQWNIVIILLTFNVFAEDVTVDHTKVLQNSVEPQQYMKTSKHLQNTKLPFEITANITYSAANYNILSNANSILKWRDSKGFGSEFSTTANLTNKFSITGSIANTKLNGGAMSDYDLANVYPDGGTFSENTDMSGNIRNISLFLGYDLKNTPKNTFTGLLGFRQYNLTFNPTDLYQVSVDKNSNTGTFNYLAGASQTTTMVIKGLQIGFNYEHKTSENHNYSIFTSVFLPTHFSSKQYNWGYNTDGKWDWKLSSTGMEPFQNFGLNVKLQSQVKVARNIWWNYYAFLNTIRVKSATEVDRKNNGATINIIGDATNARMNQFGIGMGVSFK